MVLYKNPIYYYEWSLQTRLKRYLKDFNAFSIRYPENIWWFTHSLSMQAADLKQLDFLCNNKDLLSAVEMLNVSLASNPVIAVVKR